MTGSPPAAEATRILVVENSPTQARIICQQIESRTRFGTVFCSTLAEVREVMEGPAPDVFLAVLNLSLRDAPDGEAVDYVLTRNIPSVVLTTTFDEAIRNRFLEKNVLDYLNKGDPAGLDVLVDIVERISGNQDVTVLLADDNNTVRSIMRRLLTNQNFRVLEAADGQAALDLLAAHPEVRLVVTDYEMPVMDGLEFIARARASHPKEKLAIIGVSALDSGALTARFLKNGANDFLKKPFEVEEFYCRVNKNVGELERIGRLREASRTDPLTGCLNLRHFMHEARTRGIPGAVLAWATVDGLWETMAAHGWEAAETLLARAATHLEQYGPWAALGRDGEGFALLADKGPSEVFAALDAARGAARGLRIRHQDAALELSFSFAVGRTPGQGPAPALAALRRSLAGPTAPGRALFV